MVVVVVVFVVLSSSSMLMLMLMLMARLALRYVRVADFMCYCCCYCMVFINSAIVIVPTFAPKYPPPPPPSSAVALAHQIKTIGYDPTCIYIKYIYIFYLIILVGHRPINTNAQQGSRSNQYDTSRLAYITPNFGHRLIHIVAQQGSSEPCLPSGGTASRLQQAVRGFDFSCDSILLLYLPQR